MTLSVSFWINLAAVSFWSGEGFQFFHRSPLIGAKYILLSQQYYREPFRERIVFVQRGQTDKLSVARYIEAA